MLRVKLSKCPQVGLYEILETYYTQVYSELIDIQTIHYTVDNIQSVSYTHLDVYKRQEIFRNSRRTQKLITLISHNQCLILKIQKNYIHHNHNHHYRSLYTGYYDALHFRISLATLNGKYSLAAWAWLFTFAYYFGAIWHRSEKFLKKMCQQIRLRQQSDEGLYLCQPHVNKIPV